MNVLKENALNAQQKNWNRMVVAVLILVVVVRQVLIEFVFRIAIHIILYIMKLVMEQVA